MSDSGGSVLVADDDPELRSLYRVWLADNYDVQTAGDGVDALDRVDAETDVVVLDREMPHKCGETVAEAIDRGEFAPLVVMISGVEPGPDVLDVPVDAYLQKPVTRAAVVGTIQRHWYTHTCHAHFRTVTALATRMAVVEQHTSDAALAKSDTYTRGVARLERERAAIETMLADPQVSIHADPSGLLTPSSIQKSL